MAWGKGRPVAWRPRGQCSQVPWSHMLLVVSLGHIASPLLLIVERFSTLYPLWKYYGGSQVQWFSDSLWPVQPPGQVGRVEIIWEAFQLFFPSLRTPTCLRYSETSWGWGEHTYKNNSTSDFKKWSCGSEPTVMGPHPASVQLELIWIGNGWVGFCGPLTLACREIAWMFLIRVP